MGVRGPSISYRRAALRCSVSVKAAKAAGLHGAGAEDQSVSQGAIEGITVIN